MEKNTSKFNEYFIKNHDENSNKGNILTVYVEYPKNLHDLHRDLPFLPKRMKIKECNKFVCKFYDKNNYVARTRVLKHALNHGLILKKNHRVSQVNQETWLK